MATEIKTGVLQGIEGVAVTVEVDLTRGLPGFHLVGLPNTEVRESRERVLAAVRHSGCKIPPGRITVNLAPAGVRKEGAFCDLAIAMGVIAASGGGRGGAPGGPDGLDPDRRLEAVFLGELSLFGEIRPLRGLLPILLAAARRRDRLAVVPAAQAAEAALVPGLTVVPVSTLGEVLAWWRTGVRPRAGGPPRAAVPDDDAGRRRRALILLQDLRGQALVRKAAVLAVVGEHNLLMVGPPGSGKTRLARILGRLRFPLEPGDALDTTRIHSAAGLLHRPTLMTRPPFRAPHHTITRAGLTGGGPNLRPGEVTLAHGGVLFLDELTEFAPAVLEALREPLEEGWISVTRGAGHRRFPARFQLIAAMNPCRCGFAGSRDRPCRCGTQDLTRHRNRLSGPLLDRFDLFVEVGAWEGGFLQTPQAGAGTGPLGWRTFPQENDLARARDRLLNRPPQLAPDAAALLDRLRQPLGLSLRGVTRCVRLAATLAALDGAAEIGEGQVKEALEFRKESLPALQGDPA